MILVAGYCRVSTDHADQINSFESQQRYFASYIKGKQNWELYDIYADEGITGTSTKKRAEFNRMIDDAHNGKFQLILTKEVSRFSRNILDVITYTRMLKELGIGVVFLSDGFCSLDADAELRLSIMGSIAQEESRKTSSRVKWGQSRQMEKGVVFGTSMLGYDLRNGKLTINPEGANVVKQIFHKYGVEKKGTTQIAHELQESGALSYKGNTIWRSTHILKILKNEKYVGDLVQKKTFTPDYLTHSKKYNHGQEALIALKNHHEGIISRDLWNVVQNEIAARRRKKDSSGEFSRKYPLSGKIICGECGGRFVMRSKQRKDGTTYRLWRCGTANRYGAKKHEASQDPCGCDIGCQISNDLALDILQNIIAKLHIDSINITENVMNLLGDNAASTAEINQQINRITAKKIAAIEANLSNRINNDELMIIKETYDIQIKKLSEELEVCENGVNSKNREVIAAILSGARCRETYLATLLEYMRIYKDGTVEVKLQELPVLWRYRLFT